MQHQARVLQAHEPEQIRQIMDILIRASGGREIDSKMVEQSLLEVIHAIGLAADGTEESGLWQEFSAEDEPSHQADRDGFLQLTAADDPFELAQSDRRLSDLLSRDATLRRFAQQRRKTSNSQAPIWRGFWGSVSPEEQAEIRKSLKTSARYHDSLIRRGRVQKTKLDTALLELADLYLTWTEQTIARHHVPYSSQSRFIQFAVAALQPAAAYFEVSSSALSGRWERVALPDRKEERALNEALFEQEPEQKP
ncbi:MAG: hypothetical protein ACYTFF_20860 [Planctomycetota bacterium]|jgi:hypothetical protein